MKIVLIGLLLAGALSACASTTPSGSMKLTPGLQGDGTVLSGVNGEPLYPTHSFRCGNVTRSFRFGIHSLTVCPETYLWAWSLPVSEREEAGAESGFVPASSFKWEMLHRAQGRSLNHRVSMGRRIVDVVMASPGVLLLLEETPLGETVVEAWDFGAACTIPDCTDGRGGSVDLRGGLRGQKPSSDGGEGDLDVRRWERLHFDLGGSPEAICTTRQGRFVFLLTRNRRTQLVVLHQFDFEGEVFHSILETSDNLRMLATCMELSVREIAGSDGFLLRAFGTGELKDSKGRIVERLPLGVNLYDSNGDGELDGDPVIGGPTSWRAGTGRKLR